MMQKKLQNLREAATGSRDSRKKHKMVLRRTNKKKQDPSSWHQAY